MKPGRTKRALATDTSESVNPIAPIATIGGPPSTTTPIEQAAIKEMTPM
jgi:hypothetical protein